MKITRRQLRRMILKETRELHAQGIRDKIARLEPVLAAQEAAHAVVRQQAEEETRDRPDDPYSGMEIMSRYGDPILEQIAGIQSRLKNLHAQLAAFEESERAGVPVGQLPRY